MRRTESSGWVTLAGPAACAVLTAAILLGHAGAATAEPPGPGTRAQTGADTGTAAYGRGGQALTSTQNALTRAERDLAGLEGAAQQATTARQRAAARVRAAEQASVRAGTQARVAKAAAVQARSNLGRLAAAVYRYGPAQSTGTLLLMLDVSDPAQYLDGVHTIRRVLVDASTVVAQAQAASRDADATSAQATDQAAAVTSAERAMARTAVAATAAADAAEARVSSLGSELDAELGREGIGGDGASELARGLEAEAAAVPATGPVFPYDAAVEAKAVSYALAQLGKPYLWGGAGPQSFDCSGLAMRAYETAGVELPHFAAFQYAASHPLTYSQLRPGDLLFWATDPKDPSTIYHEAVYLGGGQMVQAPKTGWNVMVSNMWMWGAIQFYARP
ncbi:C40 family peptidase [Actinospica durhamensis]|uniref:C40 family peptidase n=1 Tax=Actinospica durhamensis TaxID=1508375 RepID=A0A941EP48_9ACTN|nr:C40 family peptidase [Actinospica durhamensis]MBR7835307.1 C40 family peptidase [Actinospica durhamensis]